MKLFRRKEKWNPPPSEDTLADAELAVESSRRGLRQTRLRRVEVNRITSSLEELRERNHFAELIRDFVRGEEG